MIKKLAPTLGLQPRYLFIAPESIERLRERLHLRCTEKNDEIELRLRNAVTEITIIICHIIFLNGNILFVCYATLVVSDMHSDSSHALCVRLVTYLVIQRE